MSPRVRRALSRAVGPEGLPFGVTGAHCPNCGSKLASIVAARMSITIDYSDGDDVTGSVEREVDIGARVTLETGFVNAKRRHASGHAWYTRSAHPPSTRPSPRVRLPAVVTCGCGQDVLLDVVGDSARVYATAPEEGRIERLDDDLAEEGRDAMIDAEIDRMKELRSGAFEANGWVADDEQ